MKTEDDDTEQEEETEDSNPETKEKSPEDKWKEDGEIDWEKVLTSLKEQTGTVKGLNKEKSD